MMSLSCGMCCIVPILKKTNTRKSTTHKSILILQKVEDYKDNTPQFENSKLQRLPNLNTYLKNPTTNHEL